MLASLKKHIHYKRRQFKEIRRITDSLTMEEIFIRLDYSENYKPKHQTEIQSAYFGPHAHIIKMVNCQSQLPTRRVISRELHSYRVSIKSSPIHWKNSTNKLKLCILLAMGMPRNFNHAVSYAHPDITHRDITIDIINETHHGKSPIDGIGGTLKNLVYCRVLSDVVINTPPEFAEFSNQIRSVDCLYLDKSEFIQEPEELSKATPIPSS